jgi:lipopolysaccharide/colanic/teichoic acid biosynthesis glycosyltransferase
LKRAFDVVLAALGLIFCGPLILLCWLIAALETKSNGFFIQQRIGQHGRIIHVVKIKTMYPERERRSAIAACHLGSITRCGAFFRNYKLDELPQLFNVLIGDMSLVGPRPDIPGYADKLKGRDRVVLQLKPGITGPASIKYRNEDEILAATSDPVMYNDQVIWPDKVKINRDYYEHYSILSDIQYLIKTIMP